VNVLGITGRRRQAAAALSVDGVIAAAATEECCVRLPGIGYEHTGGFPAAAASACLARAGLSLDDLDGLAIVDEGVPGHPEADGCSGDIGQWRARMASLPMRSIDPIEADAVQASLAVEGDARLLVCSIHPPALAAYVRADGVVREHVRGQGAGTLACMAQTLARSVGADPGQAFAALDRLAVRGELEFAAEFEAAIRWREPFGVSVDLQRIGELVGRLAEEGNDPNETFLPNVRMQQRRSNLAASFIDRVAQVVADAVAALSDGGAHRVALGGSLFAAPHLNTRVWKRLGGRMPMAAVPEAAGRAIGAAASGNGASSLTTLALGPAFSDQDIKATLDNCRLDYVYEPDWRRLLVRVSKMLSRGMVVGWFQGPMVFGGRSLGTRSLLCDPSTRYARENVNEYLRRMPLDEPLPVSLSEPRADECLSDAIRSPHMLLDADVKSVWRDRLRAALDCRHGLRVHTTTPDQAPELCELLDLHYERCRVPGLINTNLSGPGEPIACSPRDALRTMYSSATDALVIGRFLLMKDYWLLRSDAN
jgi:predicted NodU family carbamoyl transferase